MTGVYSLERYILVSLLHQIYGSVKQTTMSTFKSQKQVEATYQAARREKCLYTRIKKSQSLCTKTKYDDDRTSQIVSHKRSIHKQTVIASYLTQSYTHLWRQIILALKGNNHIGHSLQEIV